MFNCTSLTAHFCKVKIPEGRQVLVMSAIPEEEVGNETPNTTLDTITAEFCARELAKSRKMQMQTLTDKSKTASLKAELTQHESVLVQSAKQMMEDELKGEYNLVRSSDPATTNA